MMGLQQEELQSQKGAGLGLSVWRRAGGGGRSVGGMGSVTRPQAVQPLGLHFSICSETSS